MNRRAHSPWALALLGALVGAPAAAQDFAAPGAGGPMHDPLDFLERGFAPRFPGARVDAAAIRWLGVPELATRALGAALGFGSARMALGISQTGEPDIGWSTLGAALGGATRSSGAGFKAVLRRDREPGGVPSALGPGVGAEVGGAAWIAAGARWTVWASHPQLWTRGVTPPLIRTFEVGAALESEGAQAWLSRAAPLRSGGAGFHACGLGLEAATGPFASLVWLEARDRPLRGAIGIRARVRRLAVAGAVEGHPVLGETVRLAVGLVSAQAGP